MSVRSRLTTFLATLGAPEPGAGLGFAGVGLVVRHFLLIEVEIGWPQVSRWRPIGGDRARGGGQPDWLKINSCE